MQAVNTKNQCFVVWDNEIEARFDPHFYKPEFIEFIKKLRSKKYKTKQIKDFARVICGPFGSSIKVKDYGVSGIPLIRIANINENEELSSDNAIFISEELAEKLKSYKVKEGDLIISQRGTLGLLAKVSNFYDGAIISANFIAIKEIQDVSPDYLKLFMSSNQGRKQLLRKTSGQVQTKITTDDIKSILVPIPKIRVQNQIVEIMLSAYKQKAEKETEAEKLLDSIDNCVLGKLGIKTPEIKEKMCFSVGSEKAANSRLDSYYYQPKFEEINKSVKNGGIRVKELKDSFKDKLIKGILPNEDEKDGEVKVLQIKNILRNGSIDTSEYITSKNIFRQEHKIKNGEVIVVITGATIGKVGLWHSEEEFYLSGDMVKFSTNIEFNPYYVQAFLLSKLGQCQLLRRITGATNKHLSPDDVEKIEIPFPSLSVQNEIANEIKRRIERAKKLRSESKNIVENAKKEVEKTILAEST